jgi:hypothetical protein
MKFRVFILGIVAMAAPPASAQLAVQYPAQLEAHYEELRTGEVMVDVSVDGTRVHSDTLALIDAPADQVFLIIADFARQVEWVPDLMEAHVITRSGEHLIGQGTTNLAWPFTDRTWQINIHNRAQTLEGYACYVSSWDYVPGSGDMLENDGYWLICPWTPDTSQSIVRYVFLADADVSVPDFLQRRVTAQMVPQFIHNLRRQVRDSPP